VNGDKLVRWTAVLAVLAVAAVAALISYKHAVLVVTSHGETGVVGRLYPVVIDGLIVAASMVLLDAARHREPAPRLAWWMLAGGIGGTLAANVLAGTASGPVGAVIAAWPALAFVGCYELVMLLVRASARRAGEEPPPEAEQQVSVVLSPVPADVVSAAAVTLRATIAAGNPLSLNQLSSRFGLTRAQATRVRSLVLAEANGHEAIEEVTG
jgi:hypothetical protein